MIVGDVFTEEINNLPDCFLSDLFFFATNAVHNVILPYHQNIILHKIAFLFSGKKR